MSGRGWSRKAPVTRPGGGDGQALWIFWEKEQCSCQPKRALLAPGLGGVGRYDFEQKGGGVPGDLSHSLSFEHSFHDK